MARQRQRRLATAEPRLSRAGLGQEYKKNKKNVMFVCDREFTREPEIFGGDILR